jgi:hypothetical protein
VPVKYLEPGKPCILNVPVKYLEPGKPCILNVPVKYLEPMACKKIGPTYVEK